MLRCGVAGDDDASKTDLRTVVEFEYRVNKRTVILHAAVFECQVFRIEYRHDRRAALPNLGVHKAQILDFFQGQTFAAAPQQLTAIHNHLANLVQ